MSRLFSIEQRIRRRLGLPTFPDIAPFIIPPSRRHELLEQAQTDMARLFFGHKGRPMLKPIHYPDLYDKHFSPYRGKPVTMLEIGVAGGGSLEMWREYFGKDATIFGIDINPKCSERADPPNQVRIGSQADPEFLRSVIEEMGPPDIILDDGSHIAKHQRASFRALFPALKSGGLYVIEDLITSYWRPYGGGYRRPGTAIELVKQLIDDMHGWYHNGPVRSAAKDQVTGLHVYDLMVFIDKGERGPMQHISIE